jgi:hypothetical protein
MWQHIVAYLCVAAAALYLGRYIFHSVRAVIKARSGCGDGCSNCAFAERPKSKGDKSPAAASGKIIPLTDIRSLPHRKS